MMLSESKSLTAGLSSVHSLTIRSLTTADMLRTSPHDSTVPCQSADLPEWSQQQLHHAAVVRTEGDTPGCRRCTAWSWT